MGNRYWGIGIGESVLGNRYWGISKGEYLLTIYWVNVINLSQHG